MKKLINIFTLFFAVASFSSNAEKLSNVEILSIIENNLKIIDKNTDLQETLNIKLIESDVSKNIDNKEELLRINKELEMAIGNRSGTICIT